jgi:hypothetical protein
MHLCPALCLALSFCHASPYRLLSKTKVSIAAAGGGSNSTVSTASLSAKGAKLRNTYDSKHMSGFVMDLPDGVDEEEVISKLNAHDDVVKVVPDTWVGIAGAAGKTSGDCSVLIWSGELLLTSVRATCLAGVTCMTTITLQLPASPFRLCHIGC